MDIDLQKMFAGNIDFRIQSKLFVPMNDAV